MPTQTSFETVESGPEVARELLRPNSTDCIFASPIAAMASFWEALAAQRERGGPEVARYFQCRHEMLAVAVASGLVLTPGMQKLPILVGRKVRFRGVEPTGDREYAWSSTSQTEK